MPLMRLLAFSIATALVSEPASAAVVCEFEPTPDMSDCRRCFKSDGDGSSLFLDGKRMASSTDADRFRQVRIGAVDYQRGVEKVLFSQRNGAAHLYEVCYASEMPVRASDLDLVMTAGADIQEFRLRVNGAQSADQYEFHLAGTLDPKEGTAGLFGNTFVFSPSSEWSGQTTLRYVVANRDGSTSSASITIHEDDQLAALRAEKAEFQNLQDNLLALQGELDAEYRYGVETQAIVEALEQQVERGQDRLAKLDQSIAEAESKLIRVRALKRARRIERLLRKPQTLWAATDVSALLHGDAEITSNFESEVMAPMELPTFLVPTFAHHARIRSFVGQEPWDEERRRRQRRAYEIPAPRQPRQPRRRLTKREKKRAKRARAKRYLVSS